MLLRKARAFSPSVLLPKESTIFCSLLCSFSSTQRSRRVRSRRKPSDNQDDDEIILDDFEVTGSGRKSNKTNIEDEAKSFIPKNFSIRHLLWPLTDSSILLLGIDRRDSMHGSFLQDILVKSNAELISVQISPDEPFFVRTDSNYKLAWRKFIAGNFDQRFLVNPNPQFLADVLMDAEKNKIFIEGPVMKTPEIFEVGSTFIYSQEGRIEKRQVVDCFLSPLLFTYNNPERKINIVVNDVPKLIQRDYLARVLSKKQLADLIDQYLDALTHGENFDPQVLIPEAFIHPKVAYLTEVLRQSCYVNKKIISIVDYNFVDLIEEEWKKLGREMKNLAGCLVPGLPPRDELSYTDYIERHTQLDILLEPFVKENFVDFKSFPFSGRGTIGMEMAKPNIFLIWDHYYGKSAARINKRPVTLEELAEQSKIDEDVHKMVSNTLAKDEKKSKKNKV